MKMIVIAAAALLIIGGGGAGAYLYFSQTAEAAPGAEVEAGHETAKAEDKHDKKDGAKGGHSEFVEMDPLILPIIDNDGVSQVISLVVALEVSDSAAAGVVEQMTPKLKDAFIQDMYGVLSRQAALKGGVIQVGYIKTRLNKVTASVLGEDVVHDVLLQVVQQRPI